MLSSLDGFSFSCLSVLVRGAAGTVLSRGGDKGHPALLSVSGTGQLSPSGVVVALRVL